MRLHEYHFENLGGNGVPDKSGKLLPMNLPSVSLSTVEVFMSPVVRLTFRKLPLMTCHRYLLSACPQARLADPTTERLWPFGVRISIGDRRTWEHAFQIERQLLRAGWGSQAATDSVLLQVLILLPRRAMAIY